MPGLSQSVLLADRSTYANSACMSRKFWGENAEAPGMTPLGILEFKSILNLLKVIKVYYGTFKFRLLISYEQKINF